MKIVNLETFRALPPWTVFRKFQPMVTEDLLFKLNTWEHDFIYQSVDMPESSGSEQLYEKLRQIRAYVESSSVQFWVELSDGTEVLQYLTPIDAMALSKALDRLAIEALRAGAE